MSDQILRYLGEIIANVTVAVGVAFLFFRYLGKRWIESKFAERLEQFKHQQAIEIQRLRVEIDSTLSGVLKLQEMEFESLPEAWSKLDEAYGHVADLVSPLQYHPKLDDMTEVRLKKFLDETNLRETEKDEILQSSAKSDMYQEIIFWHRLYQVRLACNSLDKYVVRYGIFFPPNLKEKLNKIAKELNYAVSDKAVGQESKDYTLQRQSWTAIKDKIDPLFQAIEGEIYARLQSHGSSQ